MIKENELRETNNPGYRLSGEDANLTLEVMKSMFEGANNSMYNLPIEIEYEQIKSGGVFNSKTEDCLSITNTQHRSAYFKYCIIMRKQINTLIVQMKYYGSSLLTAEWELAEARKNGGLIGKAIGALKGFDQAAFDEEYAYYDMLMQTFAQLFS